MQRPSYIELDEEKLFKIDSYSDRKKRLKYRLKERYAEGQIERQI